jgi:signal transduction histidine kinase
LPPFPNEVKFALCRIAQEALTNAAKHADASQITVRLGGRRGGETIHLDVKDDGQGFDTDAVPAGRLGIGLMRERARAVGATLRIRSGVGRGTHVVVHWKEGTSWEGTATGGGGTARKAETHARAGRPSRTHARSGG